MIPFDFEYYQPATIQEAVEAYHCLDREGKAPVYYGGGSELISMARLGNYSFGAVIDIKNIPECRILAFDKKHLVLGSALTLTEIREAKKFPLLEKTAGRIADHTMQCKITLGGNLAATIIYRETVLPFLLTDAKFVIAGQDGLQEYEACQIFDQRLQLKKGQFLVKVIIDQSYLNTPYFHIKKTKNEKIDYPLITTAGIIKDGMLRVAFSGLKPYPFRDMANEKILNDVNLTIEMRVKMFADQTKEISDDHNGSAEYRKFVLKETLVNILETMRAENHA